jgi:nucleotide-binding universal stress UspA family protein
MNRKRILVATDFSPCSDEALEYASALANQWNSLLLIVHVEQPPSPVANELMLMTEYFPNPEVRRMLEATVPRNQAVRYEHRLVPGEAAQEIVRLAETEQADLIVVGTHGRSGVSRLLMGSVAEVVVRHAKCPVLTVTASACPAASGDATPQTAGATA